MLRLTRQAERTMQDVSDASQRIAAEAEGTTALLVNIGFVAVLALLLAAIAVERVGRLERG